MTDAPPSQPPAEDKPHGAAEVFVAFLRLGLTSFGGPIAHLGYFRAEFVGRRRWLDDAEYADIVALCQFLPGPASSQVGIALGLGRAGIAGALAAWTGFTLPSALAMGLFASGVGAIGRAGGSAWLHGLQVAATAVVAQAIWTMAARLCPDRIRASLAVGATVIALAVPSTIGQLGAIALGAVIGRVAVPVDPAGDRAIARPPVSRPAGLAALALFALLIVALPVLAGLTGSHALELAARIYRSGALVFGGGHVVLPLLQDAVVAPGWVSDRDFLAGYAAAQAMPGPLFSIAAYLGAVEGPAPHGWPGAALALGAIYLPSFLLLCGVLPFWARLRRDRSVRSALAGVNAAVVGLLAAAFYTPVWTGAILAPADFALAALAWLLLQVWRTPPWLVVGLCALAGAAGA